MTAKEFSSPVIRLAFCILIGCLAIHFLVEDTLLLTMIASLDSAASSAFTENYDEFEHLDDLAYAESQPVKVADRDQSIEFPWSALLREQTLFSIFKPPKI